MPAFDRSLIAHGSDRLHKGKGNGDRSAGVSPATGRLAGFFVVPSGMLRTYRSGPHDGPIAAMEVTGMPLSATALASLALLLVGCAPSRTAKADELGMNLAGPADWNSELPFTDVFRLSREWVSQRKGAGWGQGPKLERDSNGWVKRLEPDCFAETLMCTLEGGRYPAGEYVCLYEGKGRIEFNNIKREVSRAPGRIVFEPDPPRGSIFLRLMKTDPSDPVRNIRVLMPGYETRYK
ncbi:MAG: hypothetical protein FJX72_12535, partial [Armatimonadetes bacterium]|nr:hypothetical protein [Armatimonadota bacterium]